jgi:hypothetical protein
VNSSSLLFQCRFRWVKSIRRRRSAVKWERVIFTNDGKADFTDFYCRRAVCQSTGSETGKCPLATFSQVVLDRGRFQGILSATISVVIQLRVGQGTALELVMSDAAVRHYGVIASSKGIETIRGNAFDTIANPESLSLLYLNPPYDSEIGTIRNRRTEAVFLEHT